MTKVEKEMIEILEKKKSNLEDALTRVKDDAMKKDMNVRLSETKFILNMLTDAKYRHMVHKQIMQD